MRQFLPLAMVFFSIVGIADASYLTYEKVSGQIPVCGQGFDCGSVLASPYAQIGPFPISVFGIFFYLSVFILSCSLFLGLKLKQFNLVTLIRLLTSAGFGFSLILVGMMAFVIQAWCLYCLVSAATSTLLFSLSLLLPKAKS
jgi:uncharacterized membrane protein